MAPAPAPSARRGRRRWPRAAIAVVTLLVGAGALAACGDDDGDGAPDLPEGVVLVAPDEDLYALAEDVTDGDPGEPIAVQRVDTYLDATVWRVLHRSESLEGEVIAVSGLVLVPSGPIPEGGRAVVSWAHGTTGLADECAPSLTFTHLDLAVPMLEQGMVVAATDYEGLGTPGLHPYLVGESQGRGVLDVARAAQALDSLTAAGDQVVLWGHSQGGHAVLFANQIADAWAPELDVVGTVSGAPPSQLPTFLPGVVDQPTSFLVGMVVAAWADVYPDTDPAEVLTALGQERMATLGDGCVGEFAHVWESPADDPLVRQDLEAVPPRWAELLEANDPGRAPGTSPVLLLHGGQDEVIPAAGSTALVGQMCEVGQPVQLLALPEADHMSVVAGAMPDVLDWIRARLADEPVADDCEA